jgi:2,3-diketo-5-methylthio-1-phosphopentane phosphatase
VTVRLGERGVQTIVLDIEGTTTPIAFVHDVLFPFARTHLREHLRNPLNTDSLREPIGRLREEWSADLARGEQPPGPPDLVSEGGAVAVSAYVEWLMDRDRKSPGLKMLQGHIWEQGYRAGVLKGEVFSDVPRVLPRWREGRLDIAIYSSGSELAQRLIFGNTPYGDLTPFISRFFDTAVGPKIAAESYRRIAADLVRTPDRILFVSDVTAELDAARSAGCQVLLCVRPGNRPQPDHLYTAISSLEEILP